MGLLFRFAAVAGEDVPAIAQLLEQHIRGSRIEEFVRDEYEIDAEILKLVSKDQCEKHRVVPVSRAGSSLIVAMADPTNLNAIDDLKFLTGYNIEPVIASETMSERPLLIDCLTLWLSNLLLAGESVDEETAALGAALQLNFSVHTPSFK